MNLQSHGKATNIYSFLEFYSGVLMPSEAINIDQESSEEWKNTLEKKIKHSELKNISTIK